MRKIIILVLASMLVFSSCQKNKTVTLTGEIQNYDQTPLLIVDFKVSSTPDTLSIKDGKFAATLRIDKPCIKFLVYGHYRKDIFLLPGQSLKISFDATKIDSSFKYEGSLATENSLLDSVSKRFNNLDFRYIYTQPVNIASSYLDSTFGADKQYFEKLVSSAQTTPIFVEFTKASIDYNYAALKIEIGLENDVKDSSFYSFINQLAIENDNYLDIPNFRMFLDYYVSLEANKTYEKLDSMKKRSPDANFDEELKVIENLKNHNIRAYSLFNLINRRLEYKGVKDFDKYYDYFKKNNTNSIYAEQIRKVYEKKQLLAPGKPAPQFTCIDIDSNQVSLIDFKGKYVYIDFWATWCGPCIQELPSYLKLQSDYKGENIAFMSISLDEDKNNWRNVVKENKNEGISLFAGQGWESEITKAYQIMGIPTFVLIDKDGNIIDSQAARPSSIEIRETLDQLL